MSCEEHQRPQSVVRLGRDLHTDAYRLSQAAHTHDDYIPGTTCCTAIPFDKLGSEYRAVVEVGFVMQAFPNRPAERHGGRIPTVQRLKAQVEFSVWLAGYVGI